MEPGVDTWWDHPVDSLDNLVPCDTPSLPVDPASARLQEWAAQHPSGIPGGRWYAYPPDPTQISQSSGSGTTVSGA